MTQVVARWQDNPIQKENLTLMITGIRIYDSLSSMSLCTINSFKNIMTKSKE